MGKWVAWSEKEPKKGELIDVCFSGTFEDENVWILCGVTKKYAVGYGVCCAYWRPSEPVPCNKFPWKK